MKQRIRCSVKRTAFPRAGIHVELIFLLFLVLEKDKTISFLDGWKGATSWNNVLQREPTCQNRNFHNFFSGNT
jgi:hypothetical protein